MNTSFDALSISSDENRVAAISLIRPKLLNRFDNQLQIELAAASLEELAKDGVGSARSSWVDREGFLRQRRAAAWCGLKRLGCCEPGGTCSPGTRWMRPPPTGWAS